MRTLISLVFISLFGLQSVFAQAQPATSESKATQNSGRLDRIQRTGVLKICIWPDYYSITYRDPRAYTLSGIEIDLAQELAHDLGVSVDFVDSSFVTLSEDLLSDACDLAMFAIAITPERQKTIRFTDHHLFSDVIGITTKTNRRIREWADIDQPGVVVSVTRGSLHEPLMKERLQYAELLVSETAQSRETDVESGRADVFMTDYPYALRMQDMTDWSRQIDPPDEYHRSWYGWAMAPGDDVWFERVQTFLRNIKKDGRLATAAKKYHLDPIRVRD